MTATDTLARWAYEDWLDEWTAELQEDANAFANSCQAQAFPALQDDTCDACRMDIYEGEPVFNIGSDLIHEGCYEREGNIY